MKKTYQSPELELIIIDDEDVIVTSANYVPDPDEGEIDIIDNF